MTKNKFEVGDKVKIKGALITTKGIIKSIHRVHSGITEYCIDFEGRNHYCYEAEMQLASSGLAIGKCECGAEKTYGTDASIAVHAFYCPIRENYNA